MTTFEITAAGFDGSTDQTDNLIYWVNAETRDEVIEAIADTGATFCHETLDGDTDVDFVLPRDTLRMQGVLLRHASDFRNFNRGLV